MVAPQGYRPTEAEVASVLDWFERYDALTLAKDIDGMADEALFPLNEVTDGRATSCDRAQFMAQMAETVGGAEDLAMESVRTPHFVNENLVFVITDSTITAGGDSQQMRYGDLLVKVNGSWKFQTMVQGGWGDA
ncbi:nuclear transport factor 2 family protein [Mycobacterium sp. PS03-16]|uniref:nuclear transport factor 2 family protein n=1 Tax=Mycobacterium sp. PS03-16 TaxID=2559611 RepID=UPI00107419AD|nr:nuclear transport factor 2 family protein [Mycobacterium sp. PS03-16]TFV55046.1 nuclear transport factor 2 family protein [Mycobacterium sp. PS03-16]